MVGVENLVIASASTTRNHDPVAIQSSSDPFKKSSTTVSKLSPNETGISLFSVFYMVLTLKINIPHRFQQ